MAEDQQNLGQSAADTKQEEERLKRILSLYEEIAGELKKLEKEGTQICQDLQGVIDHAKLTIIKQRINKNKN